VITKYTKNGRIHDVCPGCLSAGVEWIETEYLKSLECSCCGNSFEYKFWTGFNVGWKTCIRNLGMPMVVPFHAETVGSSPIDEAMTPLKELKDYPVEQILIPVAIVAGVIGGFACTGLIALLKIGF
jgi:hypothetical protein